jgi:hypothetical protein
MSGIIFVAPFLAFVVSLCVWGLFRIFGRWSGKSGPARAIGCALAAIAFPILSVLFFIWLPRASTCSGEGVTAQAANDGLLTISVPETATDVDFRHAFYSSLIDEADFTIDESAFLEWMKQNNWSPGEFYTDADGLHWKGETDFAILGYVSVTPVAKVTEGRDEDLEVRNGYYFDDYEKGELGDDSGLTVVYDKDGGRAYAWRTTF